jgi:hypothetical protein
MKINNRQQFLAVAAITAVALLAGDRLIVSPLIGAWKNRADQIAALRHDIQEGEFLKSREQSLRQRWQKMAATTLPTDTSVAQHAVFDAFDHWSEDSRVTLTGVSPSWRDNDEEFMTLECRAKASGSLAALTRFLYDVEKDPLALRVETVKIDSRDDNGQMLALDLQVSGLLLKPKTR